LFVGVILLLRPNTNRHPARVVVILVVMLVVVSTTAKAMGFVPFKIPSIVPGRFEKRIKVGWDPDRFGSNGVNGRIGISIKFSKKRPRNTTNKNSGNVPVLDR
jgi:hypothetical protein